MGPPLMPGSGSCPKSSLASLHGPILKDNLLTPIAPHRASWPTPPSSIFEHRLKIHNTKPFETGARAKIFTPQTKEEESGPSNSPVEEMGLDAEET